MENIEARVFVPITAQYTEEELANMSTFQARHIKNLGSIKVVDEEYVITLKSGERDEIRKQIIALCEHYHPSPLSVKLNTTLNRTFLVDEKYYQDDPNGILEVVKFSYGPKGEEVLEFIHNKQMELAERFRSKYGIEPTDVFDENKLKDRELLRGELMTFVTLYSQSIQSEVEKRFRFREGRFRKSTGKSSADDGPEPYTTTSELPIREQDDTDIDTTVYEFIEEKCRFFQKGMQTNAIERYNGYYSKSHPELVGPFGADNIKLRQNAGVEIFR